MILLHKGLQYFLQNNFYVHLRPHSLYTKRSGWWRPASSGSSALNLVNVELKNFGWWRSPVAHLYGVQGVAGSNPVHPTFKIVFQLIRSCSDTFRTAFLFAFIDDFSSPDIIRKSNIAPVADFSLTVSSNEAQYFLI